jgi:HSP20 family protein
MVAKNPLEMQDKQEFQNRDGERTRDRRVFSPLADIFEAENEIIVVADVPGADEETIEITLEKNVLTINANIDTEVPEKKALYHSEYAVGDFQRSFVLSNQIDREGIEATVKNGVLYLHLPKSKEAQSRKIAVKAG